MRLRIAVMVAGLAVLAASVMTAVAVGVTDHDGDWFGHRADMTSSQRGWGPSRMMSGSSTMDEMRVGSEYAYLAEMLAHHGEAVSAARQLQRSERPQMRAFGRTIVASQTAQMEQLQEWLDDWYPNRSGHVPYEPMMRDLAGLDGDRLDQAFLRDMIRHHMGAVMMSQQLLMRDEPGHEEVEAMARTIRDEQRAEIVQMHRWLRAWFDGIRHHH